MKTGLLRLFLILNFSFFIFNSSSAQFAFIPDTNFRNFLVNNGFAGCMVGDSLDTTCTAVVTATKINCASSNIRNLTGIEYFDNLDSLLCNNNTYLNTIPRFPDSLVYFYSKSDYHLSTLPPLPSTLKYLYCQQDSLLSLPALPSGLKQLDCSNNKLTSLPNLPFQLEVLMCTQNFLTILPAIPSGVVDLRCDGNALTSLPALPSSLLILNCGSNGNLSLPGILPNDLWQLACEENQLTSLPSLPQSLRFLYCYDNLLTSLPSLPNSLEFLDCRMNNLTSLPSLPINPQFYYLDCSDNNLSAVPPITNLYDANLFFFNCSNNPNVTSIILNNSTLFNVVNCSNCNISSITPAHLEFYLGDFNCSNNQLTVLPTAYDVKYLNCSNNLLTSVSLPSLSSLFGNPSMTNVDMSNNNIADILLVDSVYNLNISNNPISCLPQMGKVGTFNWTNTNIHCLPNFSHIYNSTPSVSGLGLCQPSDSCPGVWNITGTVYFDADSNCVQNGAEAGLSNIPVALDSGGVQQQIFLTDNDGRYSFRTGLGTYTIRVDTANAPYRVVCPIGFYETSALSAIDSLDTIPSFGLLCNTGFDLVAKNITPVQLFRPGFQTTVHLDAGDGMEFSGISCATNVSGSVQAILSNLTTYVSPAAGALTPSSISGDTITWNITDFSTVDPIHDFDIVVQVSTLATLSDSICISLDIFPIVGDHLPVNNHITECFPVRGALDPNEKYMSPSGIIDASTDWFTFTIFFQNVGNVPAENIYILDTLDQNLDAATFTWLSSSHDLITQLLPGNILRFNFPGIQLPDSVANEPESHGYVTFKIRKKDIVPAGVEISNIADIFFDFNPPVTTNEVSATLGTCLPVTADFAAPDSICPGACISFQNLAINAATYQWYFPGAIPASSTEFNPSNICYAEGGYYSVTLIASCMGQVDTLTRDTFITVLPMVNFTASNQAFCPGSCTDFTDLSIGGTSWQWNFPGANPATSTQQNPANICYANPGNYNVNLIVSFNACYDYITFIDFINVFSPAAVVIQQSSDSLFATAGLISYQWYEDSIPIPGATNSLYVVAHNGTYSVVAADSNACTSSATSNVCLQVIADYAASDSICPGTCISFQNLAANATYYQWYFPGAVPATSTDENPTNICYEDGGYFPVTLIAGCLNQLDTLTRDTVITVYPVINLGTGNQMLCSGNCTDFNDLTANANSWQWYFDGGVPFVSSVQNPSGICYPNPGSYNVTLVITESGCSDSVVLANFVTVYPSSSVSIQQSDDTLYATNGFVSYQWYMDSIPISGATNSFYVATQNGNYHLVAIDQNGCETTAEILNVMTGQHEFLFDVSIYVYPNPATNQLTIDSRQCAIVSIELRDLVGQEVYSVKSDGRKIVIINLSEIPDGFYILIVNSENGQSTKKILKQ